MCLRSATVQQHACPHGVHDKHEGDIIIDGNIPQDIRDQFGFVKVAESKIHLCKRTRAMWAIAGNQDPNGDEPLISAAYVLSALIDKHAYKIVGQSAVGKLNMYTNVYAMVKDK